MNDYIFCPFCGATKWVTDKAMKTGQQHEVFKCCGCKKFKYENVLNSIKTPAGFELFKKQRYMVEATIDPYFITVYYVQGVTNIQDSDSRALIVSLGQAVTFNWYKHEELIDKIKKYVLFS
jgi:hypothetical protein